MKTPCEILGYKVGDKFEVVIEDCFSKGSIVELYEDDGSRCTLFKLISGSCKHNNLPDDTAGAYEDLSYMKKIEDASNTTTNKPEEDQDDLDKAFDLLEKRLKLKANLDNKTSSAISTLTQMGFKYVDGKWTFNGGE